MVDSHESTGNQTTSPSATNFTATFEAASNKYKTLTGQDLRTHPQAPELESNNSSLDSILSMSMPAPQPVPCFSAIVKPILNIQSLETYPLQSHEANPFDEVAL